VGKSTISGYLLVREEEEAFFGRDPGDSEREVEILFGSGQKTSARLFRSAGKLRRLKLVFTGAKCQAFRSFLRKNFRPRKARGPRGVLILTRKGKNRLVASVESIAEAEVTLLQMGAQRFFAGARPICVLHPALVDMKEILDDTPLPENPTRSALAKTITRKLVAAGWEETEGVGGGLDLPGGLRRAGAQLHLTLVADDLSAALMAIAAGFELGIIDLGLILTADDRLARQIKAGAKTPAPASLDKIVAHLRTLDFMLRGPLAAIGLTVRKTIR